MACKKEVASPADNNNTVARAAALEDPPPTLYYWSADLTDTDPQPDMPVYPGMEPNEGRGYFDGYRTGLQFYNNVAANHVGFGFVDFDVSFQGLGINFTTSAWDPDLTAYVQRYVVTFIGGAKLISGTTLQSHAIINELQTDYATRCYKKQLVDYTSWPGRSSALAAYDRGRLNGFINATTKQPLAP